MVIRASRWLYSIDRCCRVRCNVCSEVVSAHFSRVCFSGAPSQYQHTSSYTTNAAPAPKPSMIARSTFKISIPATPALEVVVAAAVVCDPADVDADVEDVRTAIVLPEVGVSASVFVPTIGVRLVVSSLVSVRVPESTMAVTPLLV